MGAHKAAHQHLPPVYFDDGAYAEHPPGLSEHTKCALAGEYGVEFKFFAMQTAVIAHLLHCTRMQRGGDVVLRSPTGSGKTLAYAIPIIERLLHGAIARLRAIVIVPTHDLATQVESVFRMLTRGTSIKIALATGAATVTSEAADAARAEVLIATPGRLLDHVENTDGVTLSHVEFLVLDESDRLLADAFYGWADVVLPQCGIHGDDEHGGSRLSTGVLGLGIAATMRRNSGRSVTRKILVSATATRDPQRIAKLDLQRVTYFEANESDSHAKATTTAAAAQKTTVATNGGEDSGKYALPKHLTECAYVLQTARDKPRALLQVLGWAPVSPVDDEDISLSGRGGAKLVFTKSVEAAHRLARLLELFAWKQEVSPIVLEISREVTPARREYVLELLRGAKSKPVAERRPIVVVCSDVFARGIDIPSVDAVISYDVPTRTHAYLHRVGRTARAGREGTAVTLLLANQVRHFKAMVRDIDRGEKKCRFRDLSSTVAHGLMNLHVSKRLQSLRRVLRRESLGLLNTGQCLPEYLLEELKVDDMAIVEMVAAKKKAIAAAHDAKPAKRARIEAKDGGAEEREEDMDDESSTGEISDVEDDTFQQLVCAQVAFNWLKQTN